MNLLEQTQKQSAGGGKSREAGRRHDEPRMHQQTANGDLQPIFVSQMARLQSTGGNVIWGSMRGHIFVLFSTSRRKPKKVPPTSERAFSLLYLEG